MRGHILAVLLAYSVALLGGANTAWAQTPSIGVEQERIVSRSEFYYYDENKLRRPLSLSRSVAVRLVRTKSLEERDQYLKQLGPVAVREIGQVYSRVEFALEYLPTANQDARVATIKRLTAEQDIEVAPIFSVDGMDAIVSGVYLQTVTPMSRETVVRALEKSFGSGIGIHEVTPEGALWHVSFKRLFFLDGEKFPLTTLSLANLLQTGDAFAWVKRAYPKFVFLNAPVIPSITVVPLSGTVGEERTVVLSFRIFGKTSRDVVIEEGDIPEFMQGIFVPKASGQPPQSSFIEVRGTPTKETLRQVGPNEWYLERRSMFFLGAPEPEWVFPTFTIPYTYLGVRKEMVLPPTTFFVRPHLDAKYALQDIPPAFSLPVATFPGFTLAIPTPIRTWFDPVADLVGGRKSVDVAAKIVLGIFIALALVCFGTLAIRIASSMWATYKRRGIAGAQLAASLKEAESIQDHHAAFRAYHRVLSQVLHDWDPKFPRNDVTYQHVKDRLAPVEGGAFLKQLEDTIDLEDLFSEIESRNDASFSTRDGNELDALRTTMRLKIEKLAHELARVQEGARGS